MENAPPETTPAPPVYLPPPRRRSGGQVVTFLLGVVVGACLCYGFLSATDPQLPNPSLGSLGTSTEPAIPIPEVPTDELADINGLWPARHLVLLLEEETPSHETLELLGAFKPGAVLVKPNLRGDAIEMRDLTAAYRRAVGREGLPIVIAADMGNPNPLASGPPPAYFSLGAVGEPSNATEAGLAYGAAARTAGLDAALAPWTSLAVPGQANPATSWTAEPAQSAALAAAYADGLISEGVLPIALAFPGMGLARPKGDRFFAIEEQELRLIASNMVPLRELASGGVPGILVAHATVPVLDKRFPDRPASISPTLVGGILREKWNYSGVVVADDLVPLAVQLGKPVEELFVQCLAAGCDAVILSKPDRTTLRRICAALVALVDAGGVDPRALDESKLRLARWTEAKAEFAKRAKQPGPAPQPPNTVLLRHTVQQGETLIGVGRLHNVRVSDIKSWNSLVESTLTPGQKLNIYLPKAGEPEEPIQEEDQQEEALEAIAEDPAPETEAPRETAEDEPARMKTIESLPEAQPAEEDKPKEEAKPAEAAKPAEEKKTAAPAQPEEVAEPEEPAASPQPAEAPESQEEAPAQEEPRSEQQAVPEEAPPVSPLVPAEESTTAAEAQPEAAPPAPELKLGKYYVWSEGDTLEGVASRFGITVDQLRDWNLFDVAPPAPGMEVVVVGQGSSGAKKNSAPAGDTKQATYTVKAGDTLNRIAQQHGMSVSKLVELNGLKSANHIVPGQKLKVSAP